MDSNLLAAALMCHKVGNGRLFELSNHYGGVEPLYELFLSRSSDIPEALRSLLTKSWQKNVLVHLQALLRKHEIEMITWNDASYPALLHEIPDRPYLLFVRGDTSVLQLPLAISCVGTRTMSAYGKRVIERIIGALPSERTVVTSGLALGVDAEVHRQCLVSGVPTVAVLGGGLDRFEPLTNNQLGHMILQSGGCIVSEYPPGVRPQKYHFLERNRIIAGLSRMTIVIEGRLRSGSLVTARQALAYGREVGAVPGDVFLSTSEGPHALINDGAWLITDGESVLRALDEEADEPAMLPSVNTVHDALRQKSMGLDELVYELGVSSAEVQQQLTVLELHDILGVTSTGEYYSKK